MNESTAGPKASVDHAGGPEGTSPAPRIRWSLRAREIAALSLLTLAVVALMTVVHLYYSQQLLWSTTLREAELVARQVYSQTAHTLGRTDPAADPWRALRNDRELRELLNSSVGYASSLLYAMIADQTGTAMVHNDPTREGQQVPAQPNLQELTARHALPPLWQLRDSPQIYEVTLPFNLDRKPFGTVRLGIAVPLVRAQLQDTLRSTLLLAAFALLAALAVGIALSSTTLQPIRKLAEDMELLRRGQFDVGRSDGPKDEFGKLAYQLQLLGRQMQSDRTRIAAERWQFQNAVDQLEDGIMFFDATGRVLFANRAVELPVGKPAQDVVHARLEDVLRPEHPLRPLVRKALETGEGSRNVTVEIPAETGPVRFLVSIFPLASERHVCDGAILLLRDLQSVAVSARTFQSLIQYSAQLAALGQVTSEVTHDVRNPLHAMVVHVAFLKERLGEQPPDVRRSLDVLDAEIKRADAVVTRYMQLVRPGDVSMKPVDVNAMLQEVSALLAGDWQAKGVSITFQPDPGLAPVLGDEEMLRRAFMNIVLNACQAMPDGGGQVTITTGLEGYDVAQIVVTDTGVGVPPEEVERIFGMYYTTKPGGSGIGLPLVRRVVDMHRGEFQFLSTVGRGTSVIIRLPLNVER